MKVTITGQAKRDLKEIYHYYTETVSSQVAAKITQALTKKLYLLRGFPEMGPIDNLLEDLDQGHRYIIESNYKIVYRIEGANIY